MKSCVEAVSAFLVAHPEVSETPEAAAAFAAGVVIDDPGNSATSKSMMVGRFLEALEVLRAMAPEKGAVSPLDEIKARRDAKFGGSEAKNRGRSARKAPS